MVEDGLQQPTPVSSPIRVQYQRRTVSLYVVSNTVSCRLYDVDSPEALDTMAACLSTLDNDTLSYLLSTLDAPDMARCRTNRALKQLVDREWADENNERHSLWERHCQATDRFEAFKLRRLKRHKSWKQVWLQSRCHNCEDAHIGAPGWGVKLAGGAKVRVSILVAPSGANSCGPLRGPDRALPGALMTHNLPYQGPPVRALRGGGYTLRRGKPLQDALRQAAAAPRPRPRICRARRRTRLRQHTRPQAGAHAGEQGATQGGRGLEQRAI